MKKLLSLIIIIMMSTLCAKSQTFTLNAYLDQEVSCKGNNDGSIEADCSPSGSYTYKLTRTSVYADSIVNSSNGCRFQGLKPGTYKLVATSATGVKKTTTIKVTEPGLLKIKFAVDAAPTTNTSTDGALVIDITGGTAILQPYLVTWMKGGVQVNDPLTNNFATYLDGLSIGLYTVTIEDDHGCFLTKSYTLRKKKN